MDLDKSIIVSSIMTIHQRIRNLSRLDRSVEKFNWLLSRASMNKKAGLISGIDRVRFFKYYMTYGNTLGKDWKKYVRKYQSNYSLRKLWWRVLGLSGKKV